MSCQSTDNASHVLIPMCLRISYLTFMLLCLFGRHVTMLIKNASHVVVCVTAWQPCSDARVQGADQYMPLCKMWLDGAVARTEVGSKGPNVLQCALTLHNTHAPPAGAHITGDPAIGHTLHFRPADGSAQATQVCPSPCKQFA